MEKKCKLFGTVVYTLYAVFVSSQLVVIIRTLCVQRTSLCFSSLWGNFDSFDRASRSTEPRLILPRRGLANRLWRPSLFLDDDALLKPGSWINDPWWHKYPELRPLDLATVPWNRPPSSLRTSYLSPIKRTYVWGYRHPLRPFGIYFYSWRYFTKMNLLTCFILKVIIRGNLVIKKLNPHGLETKEIGRRFRFATHALHREPPVALTSILAYLQFEPFFFFCFTFNSIFPVPLRSNTLMDNRWRILN